MGRRHSLGILAILAVFGCQAMAQVAKGGSPRQFELKAESPKFWELFTQSSQLEKIATGFGFTEGPVWDPHGFLYVSDEEQNKLSRVYPDGRVETVLNIGDPDGSTLDAQGHLITTASVLRAIIQVDLRIRRDPADAQFAQAASDLGQAIRGDTLLLAFSGARRHANIESRSV